MRKFEHVELNHQQYGAEGFLPKRATMHSVGYDLYSPIDIVIKPFENKLIFTNIKAKFGTNEALFLCNTSGIGKKSVIIPNGFGLIECDYYGNPSNDGNLGVMLLNLSKEDYVIKRGDKISQAVFVNFLTIDNEEPIETKRTGGFGSTNKK